MRRGLLLAVLAGLVLGTGAGVEGAERRPDTPAAGTPRPGLLPLPPGEVPGDKPHRRGELDCTQCHQGKHAGVIRMYLGMGGRGTPMIPSHMVQVRVECVACHVAPKEGDDRAALLGQTFKPSEAACLGCHGEKYRGMLDRWVTTLGTMRLVVASKAQAARTALSEMKPAAPARGRVQTLVDDADFNVRFVGLAHGVHNVFYAADLLKVANEWLDEAVDLAGGRAPKLDDTLVRGGYCAVLCHEQAGVRPARTVKFGKETVPHVRHVTEFGAVCTACHSAEVHTKVTATPATCAACHHSPRNERCESCHAVQSAFYRGQAKAAVSIAPNLMAEVVGCTGCHEPGKKGVRAAVADRCLTCHEPAYTALAREWTHGFDADLRRTAEAVRAAETAVARARARGASPRVGEAGALIRDARQTLALVRQARPAHNPLAADALLADAREKAEAARARVNDSRGPSRAQPTESRP